MKASQFRVPLRTVSFWTLLAWIALVCFLILLMIWDLANGEVVTRIIWSATTLTVGVLLACLTVHAFASAEEQSGTRDLPGDDGDGGVHLHDALQRAKQPPPSV